MLIVCGFQGCVFTRDINKAIMISDAMESGTVQINSAPARGPDHFPFQVLLLPCLRLDIAADLLRQARSSFSLHKLLYDVMSLWIAGSEGQWNRIPGDNQQHKHDDQGEEHCHKPAISILHHGLRRSCTGIRCSISTRVRCREFRCFVTT